MVCDFEERQRMLQEYLKSEENKERFAPFEVLCKEYLNLRKQYENSFEELNRATEETVVRREYAKGGETIHRGVYCPGMLDMIVGGMNRGRLLKSPPKDNHCSYEYLFNGDNRMVCVKEYAPSLAYRLTHMEFFIYKDNEVLSLVFERTLKDTYQIHQLSRCTYQDGRLLRYEWTCFGPKIRMDEISDEFVPLSSQESEVSCAKVSVEDYQYEGNLVKSFYWYRYTQDIKMLNHDFISFNRDEEGYLSTYTLEGIGELKDRFAQEEPHIYTVLVKKRKYSNTLRPGKF